MRNGAKPWDASKLLGMSLEMLVRVYGHHSPDHLEEVRVYGHHHPDHQSDAARNIVGKGRATTSTQVDQGTAKRSTTRSTLKVVS